MHVMKQKYNTYFLSTILINTDTSLHHNLKYDAYKSSPFDLKIISQKGLFPLPMKINYYLLL